MTPSLFLSKASSKPSSPFVLFQLAKIASFCAFNSSSPKSTDLKRRASESDAAIDRRLFSSLKSSSACFSLSRRCRSSCATRSASLCPDMRSCSAAKSSAAFFSLSKRCRSSCATRSASLCPDSRFCSIAKLSAATFLCSALCFSPASRICSAVKRRSAATDPGLSMLPSMGSASPTGRAGSTPD